MSVMSAWSLYMSGRSSLAAAIGGTRTSPRIAASATRTKAPTTPIRHHQPYYHGPEFKARFSALHSNWRLTTRDQNARDSLNRRRWTAPRQKPSKSCGLTLVCEWQPPPSWRGKQKKANSQGSKPHSNTEGHLAESLNPRRIPLTDARLPTGCRPSSERVPRRLLKLASRRSRNPLPILDWRTPFRG